MSNTNYRCMNFSDHSSFSCISRDLFCCCCHVYLAQNCFDNIENFLLTAEGKLRAMQIDFFCLFRLVHKMQSFFPKRKCFSLLFS